MLTDVAVAAFLLACLGSFVSVNLHNILVVHNRIGSVRAKAEVERVCPHLYPHPPTLSAKAYAEVESPSGFLMGTAAAGTITYFLLAFLYPFLVFAGHTAVLFILSLQFQPSIIFYMQIVGLVLTGTGYFLFIWSVIARGKYAVSWAMTENHRLVTWGPYRYVRHPSYLGYFLMFLGLFSLWPHLLTLFPLITIPGYVRVALQEERLLLRRFGDQFLEYQRRTGRFIPKFR